MAKGLKKPAAKLASRLSAPKARSAYALFMQARYPALQLELGHRQQIVSKIGREWREMGETEKELYRAMSQSEFERRKSHLEQSFGSEEQPSLAELDASGSIGSFVVASEDPHPGTGRFGRVLFVRHRKFGHMALAKIFDGKSSAEDELAVLEKLAGLTNSVGVMQMLEHGPQWAVFPFYPATLKAHLQEVGPLPQSMFVAMASQVASGCLCLAKLGYFHGDIKPGNIMLDPAHMRAVLANFVLTVPTSKPGVEASRYTGPYRAPEHWRVEVGGDLAVTSQTESWAFACTCLEAANAQVLFPSHREIEIYCKFAGKRGEERHTKGFCDRLRAAPAQIQELCLPHLQPKPADRPCIADFLNRLPRMF